MVVQVVQNRNKYIHNLRNSLFSIGPFCEIENEPDASRGKEVSEH